MPSFKKKEKWSPEKLGRFLAKHFTEKVMKSLEAEEPSWLFTSFDKIDKSTLLKERIIFEMFLMFQGVSAYFKGSQRGFQIIDYFHQFCEDAFTQLNIFEKQTGFGDLLISRYDSYSNALKETRPPGPIYRVSKALCQFCGKDRDISINMSVSTYYTFMSIANKNLMSDLMGCIQIVD